MFAFTASAFEGLSSHESDHPSLPEIEFKCELNGKTLFTFLPEQGSERWSEVAKACVSGQYYFLDWGCNNGRTHIKINNYMAEFCVSKYGDGCGGDLIIRIPANVCVSGFENAARITAE